MMYGYLVKKFDAFVSVVDTYGSYMYYIRSRNMLFHIHEYSIIIGGVYWNKNPLQKGSLNMLW